jgi:hypothetical protein
MGVLSSVNVSRGLLNYGLLGAAILLYLGLTYLAPQPAANNTLGLSQAQIDLLKLAVTIPYLLTWGIGVFGLTALGNYLKTSDEKTPELTPLLKALHSGVAWILISTIVTSLVGAIRTLRPDLRVELTITANYLYIVPLLIGFWLIYKGVRVMLAQKASAGIKKSNLLQLVIATILVACYSTLIFTNPHREVGDGAIPAAYYLPDFMIIATIIIPVFVVWWLGFSVAFKMSDLIPHVARAESFKSMTKILYGIWSIIFTSILVQILLSLGSNRLLHIGLSLILGLLYLFILLQGAGYLFLALGVRGLQKAKPDA